MAFQRAATLYTDNPTTVPIPPAATPNVKGLTATFTTDATVTSVRNPTQATNVEREFSPGITNGTVAFNAASVNARVGWAIPTADMATVDSACLPSLAAQTLTITMSCTATGTGTGAVGANDVFTPRASLWRIDPSLNNPTLVAGASGTAFTTSAALAYGPTAFTSTVAITVPATTFLAGEILMLVLGGNLACGAGLAGGARTFVVRILHNTSVTAFVFGTSGLRQACTLSNDLVGDGVMTRVVDLTMSDDLIGVGVPDRALALAMSDDVVGDGVPTLTRLVTAAKTFDLVGDGVPSRVLALTMSDDLVGDGVPTSSKLVTAAKTFDLVGDGVLDYVKATTAVRSFDLEGQGDLSARIELPIGDLPEDGGTTIIKRLYVFDD